MYEGRMTGAGCGGSAESRTNEGHGSGILKWRTSGVIAVTAALLSGVPLVTRFLPAPHDRESYTAAKAAFVQRVLDSKP
jgi:hypothetical protein